MSLQKCEEMKNFVAMATGILTKLYVSVVYILEIGCRLPTRELKVKQSIYSSKLTYDILSKK